MADKSFRLRTVTMSRMEFFFIGRKSVAEGVEWWKEGPLNLENFLSQDGKATKRSVKLMATVWKRMRAEPNRNIQKESSLSPAYDIVLRCKNAEVVESEEEKSEEFRGERKSRAGGQVEKQTKHEWSKSQSKEEKENSLELVNLLVELKQKCRINEDVFSDIISRSPMRTQECHHYCKPYENPHSTSRGFGGVTRVVEMSRRNSHPTGEPPSEPHDVNLCDVGQWLSLCKRDPKFLQQFLMDCNNEFNAREISKLHEYWCSRNERSNMSSQLMSPAQSPAEQNLTSPESVSYEDSSLYAISPNIPSLDWTNIKPGEEEERRKSPSETDDNLLPELKFDQTTALGGGSFNESDTELSPDIVSTSSNIGTVMLKLAENNPYESTVDLNQFATVCDIRDLEQTSPPSERHSLNEKLDPKVKESAWARISQVNLDLLGKGDKDGDTQLMILLVSETEKILEYVYVIVERLLKENPEYLSFRNELNQDALYLAAFKLVREPLVASYIAEALVRGKQDVNGKYDAGNTLLHCLVKQGDSHVKVLERLVKLRHGNQTPVFDLNKKNNRGFTPLHIACETHKREVVHTYQTVRVLVENGADCTAKDYKDENTPIHTLINESCDVELLQMMLEATDKLRVSPSGRGVPSPTVVPNRQGNTALHLACGRNTLRLSHQKEVIGLLLRHGAMIQLKNINGCVPSVLVDSSRKQEIKVVLHSCRQKY